MICYITPKPTIVYTIPSVESYEKTLEKWEGYYDPVAIRECKVLLTHAYTSHKPKGSK